ncbi:MAG: bacterial translation initiation factor 2 (bIF-2) [Candidatus Electronema aureum]|uniref:Translation initiation factor IF-2 n=1 Tax=Candidatus Electronema aureum TaxID=2005002 RepID=A0A521G553_9BACT|nr:MAG: bacterial translation initiation factor 2 (bIF-2) [Candidatus Electronema aureum]
MSRIRIYDLAKEAGLKSKELAEKLAEMGYPIKSPSSTVDDDMATNIRRKVLGRATAEMTDKPIGAKNRGGADMPDKGAAVIRRRSRDQKEHLARQAEETAAKAAAEQAAKMKKAAEQSAGQETVLNVAVPAETGSAPSVEGLKKSTPAVGVGDSRPTVGAPKRAKGLARIVGQVEIPVATEEPRRSGSRPGPGGGRPSQGGAAPRPQSSSPRPPRVAANAAPGAAAVTPDASKNKKRGKRVVTVSAEEDSRAKKSGGKGGGRGKGRSPQTFSGAGGDDMPYQGRRKKDKRAKSKPQPVPVAETKAIKRRITVFETISVGDLAKRMGVKAGEIIAKLMRLGVLATLNQSLDVDTAALVAADFGYEVGQGMTEELGVEALQAAEETGGEKKSRFPVVTVMGHVDHGKTSILDAIRRTDVAAGEAGGITQHIGAYHVQAPSGDITFVDTPGHAAFTEMRSRGAKVTDIVVLVVAADDGVMEQTKEAIAHAKAADVPIVVAINKIDKDNADPARVIRELGDFGLIPEAWGGSTIFCETSAKKGIGIPELLENIQLQAEILELTVDHARKARGAVIEAQLHKGRGPVATVLVQEGTLRPGDYFIAGQFSGKVRSLMNERGEQVTEAGPSIPVEVQGLSGVPQAGDEFMVVKDEKMAKAVSDARQLKMRESELASASKVSLDNLFEKMAEQSVKELRVILRADVQGTLQAFGQAAENLSTAAVRVRVLHEGAGAITENDIHLASASEAIIIGFNIRPAARIKELAEKEHVDIRTYDVIYHALEDIEKAMAGMLDPELRERVIGSAEVRETFTVPKVGTIAGCIVSEGKIERSAHVRVLRESVVIFTGKIVSLRRFKDDVKDVAAGYECGIGVEKYNDIKVGDTLEAFHVDKVAATL